MATIDNIKIPSITFLRDRVRKGDDLPRLSPSNVRFGETQYAVPFRLALSSSPDDVFTLPLDPVVKVGGGNNIVKREVAKSDMRGTVKELWTQNDWSISVSGILATVGSGENETMEYYVERLLSLVTAPEALIVECDVLNNIYNVTHVVVESYDFPFTKGLDKQSFTLSLTSDDSYDLDIEI